MSYCFFNDESLDLDDDLILEYPKSKIDMRKIIDYDGYNEAEILEMYENGDVRTNIYRVEEGEITRSDTNIVFAARTIQFTEEEIEVLRPKKVCDENN